jgi:hypothetical protein
MLKTNSKQYVNNFKNEIDLLMKNYEEYDKVKTLNGFLDCFNNEHNFENNKKRLPNLQNRLADWLQGAPYWFDYTYRYEQITFAEKIHECKITDEKLQSKITENFYNHCACLILRIADKDTVKALY